MWYLTRKKISASENENNLLVYWKFLNEAVNHWKMPDQKKEDHIQQLLDAEQKATEKVAAAKQRKFGWGTWAII
jgi:hypothetical protein